jgi:excisionase family DNA binding protein
MPYLLIEVGHFSVLQFNRKTKGDKMRKEIKTPANGELLLWNVRQASEFIGIPVNTLYGWASRRKIPFVKVNGSLRFDPKDLKAWIDSQKVGLPDWRK